MAGVAAWPLAIGLLGGLLSPPSGASVPLPAHVRATTTEIGRLIADATIRSATVRSLVARLGCTDAIVYVEFTASPQVPTARTKLVVAARAVRFIRIGINPSVALVDRVPLLAHELQHAVEIAEQDDVRDDGAVRALFRRIGTAHGADAFETDAAKGVEWSVRSELRIKMGG